MKDEIDWIAKSSYMTPEQYRETWPESTLNKEAIDDDGFVRIIEILTPTLPGEPTQAIHMSTGTPLTHRGYQLPDGRWISQTKYAVQG